MFSNAEPSLGASADDDSGLRDRCGRAHGEELGEGRAGPHAARNAKTSRLRRGRKGSRCQTCWAVP